MSRSSRERALCGITTDNDAPATGGFIFPFSINYSRKGGLRATYTDFPRFTENEHALETKVALGLDTQ